jgi:hypothetical protein
MDPEVVAAARRRVRRAILLLIVVAIAAGGVAYGCSRMGKQCCNAAGRVAGLAAQPVKGDCTGCPQPSPMTS